MIEINESSLSALREHLLPKMSTKRYRHTLAVEDMVARLCALYCPEHTILMRAAALLHDLTKEIDTEGQVALCRTYGLEVTKSDLSSPKTFHARTASAMIADGYASFAHPLVVDAVRWHTTGHAKMTLTEALLYLADYIDESRTFPSCVMLRQFFWDAEPQKMTGAQRLVHLQKTLVLSFDLTVKDLLSDGALIARDTIDARNEMLLKLSECTE